jgi:hypothetical protein
MIMKSAALTHVCDFLGLRGGRGDCPKSFQAFDLDQAWNCLPNNNESYADR